MTQTWVLGQRALREAWRTPDALLPALFIPLFFSSDPQLRLTGVSSAPCAVGGW